MCGETSYRAKTAREREKAPDAMVKKQQRRNDGVFAMRRVESSRGVPHRGSLLT